MLQNSVTAGFVGDNAFVADSGGPQRRLMTASARPTAKRPTAKRPTAKRPTAKRPTAKRPTAKRPTAKATAARAARVTYTPAWRLYKVPHCHISLPFSVSRFKFEHIYFRHASVNDVAAAVSLASQ